MYFKPKGGKKNKVWFITKKANQQKKQKHAKVDH